MAETQSWGRRSSVLKDNEAMRLPGARVHIGCHRRGLGTSGWGQASDAFEF